MTLKYLQGAYVVLGYFRAEDGNLEIHASFIEDIRKYIGVDKFSNYLKSIFGDDIVAWQIVPFDTNAANFFKVDSAYFDEG